MDKGNVYILVVYCTNGIPKAFVGNCQHAVIVDLYGKFKTDHRTGGVSRGLLYLGKLLSEEFAVARIHCGRGCRWCLSAGKRGASPV